MLWLLACRAPSPDPGVGTVTPGVDSGVRVCQDLNCDGFPDLVQGQYWSPSGEPPALRIFWGSSGGLQTQPDLVLESVSTYQVHSADLNQDGFIDLVVGGFTNDGSSQTHPSMVHWGDADSIFAESTALSTTGVLETVLSDFNQDGWTDVLFASRLAADNAATTNSHVYYGSAEGLSDDNRTPIPSWDVRAAAAGDINGDGYPEVVLCSYVRDIGAPARVFYGGPGGVDNGDWDELPALGCGDLDITDVNGDGYGDILIAHGHGESGFDANSYLYPGSESGPTQPAMEFFGHGPYEIAALDIDGNGHKDILLGGMYKDNWQIGNEDIRCHFYLATSEFEFESARTVPCRLSYHPVAVDIDLDGYPELVAPQHNDFLEQDEHAVSLIYWGSSSGWTTNARSEIPTIGPSHASVSDVDNDGTADIVISNYFSGDWSDVPPSYIYYGRTGTYGAADRTDLDTEGAWPRPLIVGPPW